MLHLRHGGGDSLHLLAEQPGAPGLLGYAHLDVSDAAEGPAAELAVSPAARRRGAGRPLLDELRPAGRSRIPGDCACGPTAPTPPRTSWPPRTASTGCAGSGSCAARCSPRWTRSSSPPGSRCAPSTPTRDIPDWLALNAAAFTDLPDQGGWTREDLEQRMAEPLVRSRRLPAWPRHADGRLVGFHWTKVHSHGHGHHHLDEATHRHADDGTPATGHAHEPIGEVYVVGVDPAMRGPGPGPRPDARRACTTCATGACPRPCSTWMPTTRPPSAPVPVPRVRPLGQRHAVPSIDSVDTAPGGGRRDRHRDAAAREAPTTGRRRTPRHPAGRRRPLPAGPLRRSRALLAGLQRARARARRGRGPATAGAGQVPGDLRLQPRRVLHGPRGRPQAAHRRRDRRARGQRAHAPRPARADPEPDPGPHGPARRPASATPSCPGCGPRASSSCATTRPPTTSAPRCSGRSPTRCSRSSPRWPSTRRTRSPTSPG